MKELKLQDFNQVLSASRYYTPESFAELLVNLGVAAPDVSLDVAKNAMSINHDMDRVAQTLGITKGKYTGEKVRLSLADASSTMALMVMGKKIQAIKVVREASGLGLKEAKDTVDLLDPDCGNINDIFEVAGGPFDPTELVKPTDLSAAWKAEIDQERRENDRLRQEIRGLQEDLRNEGLRVERANEEASEAEEACRDLREFRVSRVTGILGNGEAVDLDFGTIPVRLSAILDLVENARDTRHELAD